MTRTGALAGALAALLALSACVQVAGERPPTGTSAGPLQTEPPRR
jgi:uncharacterized membrane protein